MYIILKIFVFIGYITLRFVYNFLRGFVWDLTAVSRELRKINRLKLYEQAAHVQTVVFRYKFDVLNQCNGEKDFVTIHHSFEHPSYVIRSNVTLYNITKHKAIFIECEEGQDVTESKYSPFLKEAQFKHAKKVITLPIDVFHILADSLGLPQGKLVVLASTNRYGPPLLTQIFEEMPQGVVISEPDVLHEIIKSKSKLSSGDYKSLIEHVFCFLCKPKNNRNSIYVLKILASMLPLMKDIQQVFPDSKSIFMYRDGLEDARSTVFVNNVLPYAFMQMELGRKFPKLFLQLMMRQGYNLANHIPHRPCHNVGSRINFTLSLWARSMNMYTYINKNNFPIKAVKYEYLLEDPHEVCKQLFNFLSLPYDAKLIYIVLSREDPRENSIIKKENLVGFQNPEIISQMKSDRDVILSNFDLRSSTDSDVYIAPNTIGLQND